jgi:phosphoglycerol transferase MdoB-like AlkP superfamily enzyme
MAMTWEHRGDANAALLLEAAWTGLRFDLSVAAKVLGPFVLWIILRPVRPKLEDRVFKLLYGLAVFLCAFALAAEVEFYNEFQMRLGPLAVEYFSSDASNNQTVASMVWHGYPVLRWLLACAAVTVAFVWLSTRILRVRGVDRTLWARFLTIVPWAIAAVVLHRGGLQASVLRWGDSVFSQNQYANHMAQNGVFAMLDTLRHLDAGRDESKAWQNSISEDESVRILRKATLLPGETLLDEANYPLLRRSPPTASLPLLKRPKHVVVVVMESFTARFCGAIGADFGATPNFDRLASEGILFTNMLSAGTHTAQGIFTILDSYPNVPVYETVMRHPLGMQPFGSLPALLRDRGFQTLFLYNGLFSWDNKEGFFRNHGMERFIGRDEFVNPTFMDPSWGVSDRDVFDRALIEFAEMSKSEKPFLGVILTLSNHAPFYLPVVEGLAPIAGGGDQNKRLNGIHYADWALGKFMDEAKRQSWFSDTLFVFVGDHGFGVPPVLTEVNLLHMHVPLLFYGPGIFGPLHERRDVTAGHLDILPTILGLLGGETIHQSFGRNLFALPEGDPGHAFLKQCGDANVGWIEGREIVTTALQRPARLYEYSLGFPPTCSADLSAERPARAEELLARLRSIVRVGIVTVERRKAMRSER